MGSHLRRAIEFFFFISIEIKEQANTTTRTICSTENPPQRLKKNTVYSWPPSHSVTTLFARTLILINPETSPGCNNGKPLYTTLYRKKIELFNHKIRNLSCKKLAKGGSSYSISWSISCRTEIQVGTNQRNNDNHELHDLDSSWILTLWIVTREWSRGL